VTKNRREPRTAGLSVCGIRPAAARRAAAPHAVPWPAGVVPWQRDGADHPGVRGSRPHRSGGPPRQPPRRRAPRRRGRGWLGVPVVLGRGLPDGRRGRAQGARWSSSGRNRARPTRPLPDRAAANVSARLPVRAACPCGPCPCAPVRAACPCGPCPCAPVRAAGVRAAGVGAAGVRARPSVRPPAAVRAAVGAVRRVRGADAPGFWRTVAEFPLDRRPYHRSATLVACPASCTRETRPPQGIPRRP
jgi:hypothetical protein